MRACMCCCRSRRVLQVCVTHTHLLLILIPTKTSLPAVPQPTQKNCPKGFVAVTPRYLSNPLCMKCEQAKNKRLEDAPQAGPAGNADSDTLRAFNRLPSRIAPRSAACQLTDKCMGGFLSLAATLRELQHFVPRKSTCIGDHAGEQNMPTVHVAQTPECSCLFHKFYALSALCVERSLTRTPITPTRCLPPQRRT